MDKLQQGYENLKRAKDALKQYKKMLLDMCLQDKEYQKKYIDLVDLKKSIRIRRDTILSKSDIDKLNNLIEQVKLEKASLNDWITEYVKDSIKDGSVIQDSLFDIVPVYKLIPKQ